MACKEIAKPILCPQSGLKYGGKKPETEPVSLRTGRLTVTCALEDVPITVIPPDIDGNGNGETDFVRRYQCINPVEVTLVAPLSHQGHTFSYWLVDGVLQPYGVTDVTVTVIECHQAHAIYGIIEDGCADIFNCNSPLGMRPNWAPPVARVEIADIFTVLQDNASFCTSPQSKWIQLQALRVFQTHPSVAMPWEQSGPNTCMGYQIDKSWCDTSGGCNGGSQNGCQGASCLCLVSPPGVPCSDEAYNLPCCGSQRSRVDWNYIPIPPPPAQCPDVYSAYTIDWDIAGQEGGAVTLQQVSCSYNGAIVTITVVVKAFMQCDYMNIGCNNIGCFPMQNENFGVGCQQVALQSPAINQPFEYYTFQKSYNVGALSDCKACTTGLFSLFSPLELPLEFTDQFTSCRRYFYKMRIWL